MSPGTLLRAPLYALLALTVLFIHVNHVHSKKKKALVAVGTSEPHAHDQAHPSAPAAASSESPAPVVKSKLKRGWGFRKPKRSHSTGDIATASTESKSAEDVTHTGPKHGHGSSLKRSHSADDVNKSGNGGWKGFLKRRGGVRGKDKKHASGHESGDGSGKHEDGDETGGTGDVLSEDKKKKHRHHRRNPFKRKRSKSLNDLTVAGAGEKAGGDSPEKHEDGDETGGTGDVLSENKKKKHRHHRRNPFKLKRSKSLNDLTVAGASEKAGGDSPEKHEDGDETGGTGDVLSEDKKKKHRHHRRNPFKRKRSKSLNDLTVAGAGEKAGGDSPEKHEDGDETGGAKKKGKKKWWQWKHKKRGDGASGDGSSGDGDQGASGSGIPAHSTGEECIHIVHEQHTKHKAANKSLHHYLQKINADQWKELTPSWSQVLMSLTATDSRLCFNMQETSPGVYSVTSDSVCVFRRPGQWQHTGTYELLMAAKSRCTLLEVGVGHSIVATGSNRAWRVAKHYSTHESGTQNVELEVDLRAIENPSCEFSEADHLFTIVQFTPSEDHACQGEASFSLENLVLRVASDRDTISDRYMFTSPQVGHLVGIQALPSVRKNVYVQNVELSEDLSFPISIISKSDYKMWFVIRIPMQSASSKLKIEVDARISADKTTSISGFLFGTDSTRSSVQTLSARQLLQSAKKMKLKNLGDNRTLKAKQAGVSSFMFVMFFISSPSTPENNWRGSIKWIKICVAPVRDRCKISKASESPDAEATATVDGAEQKEEEPEEEDAEDDHDGRSYSENEDDSESELSSFDEGD